MIESRIVAVLALIGPVSGLAEEAQRLEEEHGPGLIVKQRFDCYLIMTPGDFYPINCGCGRCDELVRSQIYEIDGNGIRYACRFMIVCPKCGNKRCPRASHHDYQCTGSNEPGQTGSKYGPSGGYQEATR